VITFFTISFLWWVSVVKGKQQFTDKISATILQNTWKVRTLSVCCFRAHVCESLTVAHVRTEMPAHLSSHLCTCQAIDVDGWCVENWFPHALSFSFSRSRFVLCKVFTTPGKLLGPVAAHGTW